VFLSLYLTFRVSVPLPHFLCVCPPISLPVHLSSHCATYLSVLWSAACKQPPAVQHTDEDDDNDGDDQDDDDGDDDGDDDEDDDGDDDANDNKAS